MEAKKKITRPLLSRIVAAIRSHFSSSDAAHGKLQSLLNAIPDSMFEIGLDGRYHTWHSQNSVFSALESDVNSPDGRMLSDVLAHPAAEAVMGAVHEAYAIGSSNGRELAITRESETTWFELSVAPKKQLANEDIRFVVIARDITDRKDAEVELRIAAAAFESHDAMFITNAKYEILRVNEAFSRITGYASENAIGKEPRLTKSDRYDDAFYADMKESIVRDGVWNGEILNRRKNGDIFPARLSVIAVHDQAKEVSHYIATFSDLTSRKSDEAEIENLAFYDSLTNLPNRRLLTDRLKLAMAGGIRHQRNGALFFIDLDNFKTLNDVHGHDQGDLLLQQVAERLNSCVRDSDTVARLGGDEFVVMLQDLSPTTSEAFTQAEIVGQKILQALGQPYVFTRFTHHGSASIGVTLINEGNRSVDELLKRADLAMYRAKESGRNSLRFFDPEMQANITARSELEADMRTGIREGQFLLYYQPQANQFGEIIGVEALLRWNHPVLGMVPPLHFIPVAEESGLILPLGQWILEEACRQLVIWSKYPHTAHLTLSINVSAIQFHHKEFIDSVLDTLESSNITPSRLKIELTESMLVRDIESVILKMLTLKDRGVSFALDDFGTGYSSLSYLKRLPLDQLKIDQSFLHDALNHPRDAAIISAIVAMGKSLGMMVIAEGVETMAQFNFLKKEGCNNFQGYFFGRPEPSEPGSEDMMRSKMVYSKIMHSAMDIREVAPA